MTNPWIEFIKSIDETNLVLSEERKVVAEFNSKTKDEYKIHTEIMPAPFMGDVFQAKVVILALNPGYDKKEEEKGFYTNYKAYWKKQIQHKQYKSSLPLFCLDEDYIVFSPYWNDKLKPITTVVGKDIVAQNVCQIQLFPYHTQKYKNIPKKILKTGNFYNYLPSQDYNFYIVKKAIERKAIIIIPRAVKLWEAAVPELKDYKDRYSTKSYGNIILSENNLGEGYLKIVETLNKK